MDDAQMSSGGNGDDQASTRELVLVVLEQLAISFDKLSRLDDAVPHLEKLVAIACRR